MLNHIGTDNDVIRPYCFQKILRDHAAQITCTPLSRISVMSYAVIKIGPEIDPKLFLCRSANKLGPVTCPDID